LNGASKINILMFFMFVSKRESIEVDFFFYS
jgi:hypothetical protein